MTRLICAIVWGHWPAFISDDLSVDRYRCACGDFEMGGPEVTARGLDRHWFTGLVRWVEFAPRRRRARATRRRERTTLWGRLSDRQLGSELDLAIARLERIEAAEQRRWRENWRYETRLQFGIDIGARRDYIVISGVTG